MSDTIESACSMSPTIGALAAALAKAQRQISHAVKDGANPHFKSSFSTMASVWDACREPLASNGLAVVQPPCASRVGVVTVVTMLMHESGEFIRSELSVSPKDTSPQTLGSLISYLKRYSLSAMVGVSSADDDDDGNAASTPPLSSRRPPQRAAASPAPTTAPGSVPPSGPAPSSEASPEETVVGWQKQLDAAQNAEEYKAVGKRISEARLSFAIRAQLSAYYAEHAHAHGVTVRVKKSVGPCSICGDKDHGSSVCPNATAEERGEAMRKDINGAA